jgi:hypothetical protein
MVNIRIILEKIGVPVAIFLDAAGISIIRGFLWEGCLFLIIAFVGYGILAWILGKMHMHERNFFADYRR